MAQNAGGAKRWWRKALVAQNAGGAKRWKIRFFALFQQL